MDGGQTSRRGARRGQVSIQIEFYVVGPWQRVVERTAYVVDARSHQQSWRPLFYLHHAWLDKLGRNWQSLDLENR
jgi:hypothetical protein